MSQMTLQQPARNSEIRAARLNKNGSCAGDGSRKWDSNCSILLEDGASVCRMGGGTRYSLGLGDEEPRLRPVQLETFASESSDIARTKNGDLRSSQITITMVAPGADLHPKREVRRGRDRRGPSRRDPLDGSGFMYSPKHTCARRSLQVSMS